MEPSDNTALIGGVVGGVGVLMIIIAIVAVLVCRGRRTNRDSSTELAPQQSPSPRQPSDVYQNLQLQNERMPHYAPAAKAAPGDTSIGVYASSGLAAATKYSAPPVVASEDGSKASVYNAPPRVDTYEELHLTSGAEEDMELASER